MKLSRLSERTTSAQPFFFNLSGPVGKGYPHAHADDVAFVQFCFAATATSTLSNQRM